MCSMRMPTLLSSDWSGAPYLDSLVLQNTWPDWHDTFAASPWLEPPRRRGRGFPMWPRSKGTLQCWTSNSLHQLYHALPNTGQELRIRNLLRLSFTRAYCFLVQTKVAPVVLGWTFFGIRLFKATSLGLYWPSVASKRVFSRGAQYMAEPCRAWPCRLGALKWQCDVPCLTGVSGLKPPEDSPKELLFVRDTCDKVLPSDMLG